MNSILSSTIRKTIANILRYKIHTKIGLLQNTCGHEQKDDVQVNNPFTLENLDFKSHTLRKHDNKQRQQLYDFGVYVAGCLPKYVQKVQMQQTDELEILVAPEGLFYVNNFMAYHQHACFSQCSAVTAIDVPSREYRFEVVYMLLSFRFGARARIKTYTDELTPLRSSDAIWKSAGLHEREVYDMFGVVFTHHPDLRRILTDYGFTGHPLRKDFPLTGYIEVRYDDELKKLVYEPVEFSQEMRRFRMESPWTYMKNFHEGYNTPLPKDSKKK